MTNQVGNVRTHSKIEIWGKDELSSSGRAVSEKELADRVEKVPDHAARLQVLEQELERDQIKRDFAIEIEGCKKIGLSFSGKPGPGGNYRVAGSLVDPAPGDSARLYRLAVAAARVGEVRIVADVVRIAKKSKANFDDPEYPIWRQIYEAAYERLDPKSPEAVALKKKFGA